MSFGMQAPPPSGSRSSKLPLGQKISDDCRELAAQLATDHYPLEVLKITNAIESLHMQLRKVLQESGALAPAMRAATMEC